MRYLVVMLALVSIGAQAADMDDVPMYTYKSSSLELAQPIEIPEYKPVEYKTTYESDVEWRQSVRQMDKEMGYRDSY